VHLLLAAHPRAVVFHAEFSRLVLPEGAEAVALVVQPLALVLVSAGVRQGALAWRRWRGARRGAPVSIRVKVGGLPGFGEWGLCVFGV